MNEQRQGHTEEQDSLIERDERFVVLLRHGIAQDPAPGQSDEERPLTPDGHARMKQIAGALREVFPKAQLLYSSPLVRCIQTSMWVIKSYGRSLQMEATDALRPGAEPEAIIGMVRQATARRVILVGHEPVLTEVMVRWTELGDAARFDLKKGGCYGIRLSPGGAHLEWVLPPRILRRVRQKI
jgi:phosphohistidine phosphatase